MSETVKSPRYNDVKTYFDNKRWSINRVKDAVGRWITASEYQEITGVPYE